ncbi:MAG: GAF domain-containing sensor histidine kinase [Anaerolineae bacterium]|nr:GAF domain-containing sensor histidine kinase [Anaerolineae bacterium]
MNTTENKIEWLFINLRWFFLLAVTGVIGLDIVMKGTTFPQSIIALLIFGSVANLIALVALLQNTSGDILQNLMLLNDIALTLGFIAGSSGSQNVILFVSLIPITTAAIRISWLASILLTFGVIIAYWLLSWQVICEASIVTTPWYRQALPMLSDGIILFVAGSAVSFIGVRMKQILEADQKAQEEQARLTLQSAHQKTRLIFELASTLSTTLNYELILEAALDVSDTGLRKFFTEDKSIVQIGLILLFGLDHKLYVAANRGIPEPDVSLSFPAENGVLAEAVLSAKPQIINRPEEDIELGFLQGIKECQQAIIVPLRAGYESYGFLLLASQEDNVYTEDFSELLVAICNQAVLALQNAILYQNLMDDKDRLVTIEEEARKHLAQNLHDGPTQAIASIAMRLNHIRALLHTEPEKASDELIKVEKMARLTTKEIRQMLFTLRPLILESQGLVPALEQLRQKLMELDSLVIHLDTEHGIDDLLSEQAKGSLFYIIDEAITNVRKHAAAENIWIRIYQQGSNVITDIKDDGQGFDVAKWEYTYADRGSMGLINLKDRAELVKGKTIVRSTPGEGTLITVTVPVASPEHGL